MNRPPNRPEQPDVADQLRLAGLWVTAPRRSVLRWLVDHPHATAEQVRAGVAVELGSVSTQAVYDVLAVCRVCGHAEDVDCAVGARPCLTPDEDHGYLLDEAEVVFWGLCPACHGSSAAQVSPRERNHNEDIQQEEARP